MDPWATFYWSQTGALLQEYVLPSNVVATTSSLEAIQGAQYAIHAVPVQHSRAFLKGIAVGAVHAQFS